MQAESIARSLRVRVGVRVGVRVRPPSVNHRPSLTGLRAVKTAIRVIDRVHNRVMNGVMHRVEDRARVITNRASS